MKNNHLKIIDSILIIGTVLFLASFAVYARPLVIAPLNNLQTTNNSVLFEFERGHVILIDDNIDFTSPQRINAEDNLVINLKPGKYYWKIEGIAYSEIRELTILSEVNLKLKKVDDVYKIVNAGNVKLSVEIYDNNSLIDNVVLDVDEEQNISGEKFVGGEYD
jgi:hypothetical protein